MSEVITKFTSLDLYEKRYGNRRRRRANRNKSIDAYLTTFGNKDVVGDIINEKALDNYLSEFDGNLPMLLNHDVSQIIGKWTALEKDDYGIIGEGVLNETSLAKDVEILLEDGSLNSVSIGFKSNDFETRDDGGRTFNDIKLFETSIVLFPANKQADILSVKDDDGVIDERKLEAALRDVGLSQRERKALISGGLSELQSIRDVASMEDKKREMVLNLTKLLR